MTQSKLHQRKTGFHAPASAGGDASQIIEEIWRSQSRRILATTYRITRNLADAEDALQDAFLKAYLCIGDFDGRSSLATWLTRIAINSSLMILRKRRGTAAVSIDDSTEDRRPALSAILADDGPGPEAQCAQSESERLLREKIAALPSALRPVVQFRALEERTAEETAGIMGLSISATKSRFYRARASLRSSLRLRGASPVRESQTSPLE